VTLLVVFIIDKIAEKESILPASLFISKYIGNKDVNEYRNYGALLGVIYGSLVGGFVAVVLPIVSPTIVNIFVWGVPVGLMIGIIGSKFWMETVLGVEMSWKVVDRPVMRSHIKFIMVNIVYGIVVVGMIIYGIV
jgi:hypothetical protein